MATRTRARRTWTPPTPDAPPLWRHDLRERTERAYWRGYLAGLRAGGAAAVLVIALLAAFAAAWRVM